MRTLIAIVSALLTVVGASEVQAQYRMAVNHGTGWSEAPGDYRILQECNREAAAYAVKYSARTGCADVLALKLYFAQAAFQQAAAACAAESGVRITHKPGAKVTIFGSPRERFEFSDCMAKSGQATD